jgi:hypothetical protein
MKGTLAELTVSEKRSPEAVAKSIYAKMYNQIPFRVEITPPDARELVSDGLQFLYSRADGTDKGYVWYRIVDGGEAQILLFKTIKLENVDGAIKAQIPAYCFNSLVVSRRSGHQDLNCVAPLGENRDSCFFDERERRNLLELKLNANGIPTEDKDAGVSADAGETSAGYELRIGSRPASLQIDIKQRPLFNVEPITKETKVFLVEEDLPTKEGAINCRKVAVPRS